MIRRKKFKILLVSICAFLVIAISCSCISYAVLTNTNTIAGTSKVGKCEIISTSNVTDTESGRIAYQSGATVACPISITINCPVEAVLRAKVAVQYYNSYGTHYKLPINFTYTFGNDSYWEADAFNLVYYYNQSLKNTSGNVTINFITQITFDTFDTSTGALDPYDNTTLQLVVEYDLLQHEAIDYSNHPWAVDTPPTGWLSKMENLLG